MPFLALAFFIVLACLILAVLGYAVWVALPQIRKKRAGAHPLDADFEAEITPPARPRRTTTVEHQAPARSNRQRLAKHLRRQPVTSRVSANDVKRDARANNKPYTEEHSIGDATLLRSYGMRPQKNAQAANTVEHLDRQQSVIQRKHTSQRMDRAVKGSIGSKRRVQKPHLKAVRSPEREAS